MIRDPVAIAVEGLLRSWIDAFFIGINCTIVVSILFFGVDGCCGVAGAGATAAITTGTCVIVCVFDRGRG